MLNVYYGNLGLRLEPNARLYFNDVYFPFRKGFTMNILITGATGLVGKELGKLLALQGHRIFVISRHSKTAKESLPFPCEVIEGDLSQQVVTDSRLASIEGVVNLMGEPLLNGRWDQAKKQRLYSSRILGTRNLVASLPQTVKVFVSGSAVGFYGDCGAELISEEHAPGTDYLAQLCVEWEQEAQKASGRKVLLRTGVVLARQGGALDQMMFPFRAGLGGVLGTGEQWMSWIHIDDLVGLIAHSLQQETLSGPLNGTAPEAVTNKYFSEQLAKTLGVGLGPAVPLVALKTLFGEAAQVMVSSLKADYEKARSAGYDFKYPALDQALGSLCKDIHPGEEVVTVEKFVSSLDSKQSPHRDLKKHPQWHYEHEVRPFCQGNLVTEKLRYEAPFGYLGWLARSRFVRKDMQRFLTRTSV